MSLIYIAWVISSVNLISLYAIVSAEKLASLLKNWVPRLSKYLLICAHLRSIHINSVTEKLIHILKTNETLKKKNEKCIVVKNDKRKI